MSQKVYVLTTSVIFGLIALVHAVRLIWRWEVLVNGWPVPLWASVTGTIVAGFLLFQGVQVIRRL